MHGVERPLTPNETPVVERGPGGAEAPLQQPRRKRRKGGRVKLGVAEWLVGAGLMVGSLAGPWLTLVFPTAAAFAVHDRRWGVRVTAAVLGVAMAALSAALPEGRVLLAGGAAATVVAVAGVAARRVPPGLGSLAMPVVAATGAGLAIAAAAAPEAIARWEVGLGQAVVASARGAVDRYRALGMDPAALDAMGDIARRTGAAVVRLWPALVALGMWAGVWLAHRLVGRWGRIAPGLGRRIAAGSFLRARVGETAVWILIAALAALWLPSGPFHRAGVNAAFVLAVAYGIQGLAVALWWMRRRGIGAGWRAALLIGLLALLPPVVAVALCGVGLADHWLDFRARPTGRHADST